jgi:hypothetical protein
MESIDLDFMAGVGGSSRPQFTVIEVNNKKVEEVIKGRKMKVLNPDGGFITNVKNSEGKYETVPYTNVVTGVVLMVRSSIKENYEEGMQNGWYSPEFNALDTEQLIPIYRGKQEIFRGTYQEIKNRFRRQNKKGEWVNDFTYLLNIYLYIPPKEDLDEEIIKLRIKGKSRSNFFEYQEGLNRINIRSVETVVSTYLVEDAENPYYAASFMKGAEVNKALMDKKCSDLYSKITRKTKALGAPKRQAIAAPQDDEIPTINLDDEVEEIRIEDVPF